MSVNLPALRVTVAAAVAVLLVIGARSINASPRAAGSTPHGALILAPDHASDPYDALTAVRTRRPVFALTFDDGPDPVYTPQVLAVLAANRAHATFFDVGTSIAAHAGLARATVAAGQEVANHTYDHLRLPPLGDAALQWQIAAQRTVARHAGLPATHLFRPPYGYFDGRVSAAAARQGLRVIGWDVPLEREMSGHTIIAAVHRLVSLVYRGSIVLAHDSRGDRSRTIAVLARLLPALRARGLRAVTVSDLLGGR